MPMFDSAVNVIDSESIQPASSIWTLVREQAEDLARREPTMRAILEGQFVSASDNVDVVAQVLAARLSVAKIDFGVLCALFRDVLRGDPELMNTIGADLIAVRERDPACRTYLHALLNLKGFQGLQTHRIANRLWYSGRTEIASWLSSLASLVFGPDIHPAAEIGASIMLDHGSGIVIGETAVVKDGVSILQNVTLGGTGKETGDRHPKVDQGVMIGAGAKILGNIEIGAFSKIAAGSVVLQAVPPRCTVAGVPAKVVRVHPVGEIPAASMDQRI